MTCGPRPTIVGKFKNNLLKLYPPFLNRMLQQYLIPDKVREMSSNLKIHKEAGRDPCPMVIE